MCWGDRLFNQQPLLCYKGIGIMHPYIMKGYKDSYTFHILNI